MLKNRIFFACDTYIDNLEQKVNDIFDREPYNPVSVALTIHDGVYTAAVIAKPTMEVLEGNDA